jgi:hypothetical protein
VERGSVFYAEEPRFDDFVHRVNDGVRELRQSRLGAGTPGRPTLDSAPASAPPPSPAPAPASWTQQELGYGASLGLSVEDLNHLGRDRFQKVLDGVARSFEAARQRQAPSDQPPAGATPAGPAPPNSLPATPAAGSSPPAFGPFTADPEQWDDASQTLIKHYNGWVGGLSEKMQQFESFMQQWQQQQQADMQRGFWSSFDTSLDNADPEFYGTSKDVAPNTEFSQRRQTLAAQVKELAESYMAAGRDVPDIGRLVKMAEAVVFADKPARTIAAAAAARARNRQGQFVARADSEKPTGRAEDPRTQAIAAARRFMEERGMTEPEFERV